MIAFKLNKKGKQMRKEPHRRPQQIVCELANMKRQHHMRNKVIIK